MRRPPFRKPRHRVIAGLLQAFDADFLLEAQCFFGGGTCLTLALDEYRESRDIDFLCSSREGFRSIREGVGPQSLGRITRKPLPMAREVRADRDGIRTYLAAGDDHIKFELILEGRIELTGKMDDRLGVPVLDVDSLVAEKLLANADRGLDDATYARDLIDLAFLAASVGTRRLAGGLAIAERAYGAAAANSLAQSLQRLRVRPRRLSECARVLGVEDLRTLKKGIALLQPLASKPKSK